MVADRSYKADLDRLREEKDPRRRRLLALGLLGRELASVDIEPILVGGAALEFYTAGGYATYDVDVEGLRVVVIGVEDLLIDRLRAWVHWRSEEDGRWTRRLAGLHGDRIDWNYLRERTRQLPEEAAALRGLEVEFAP